jgi:hypothetical protein
MNILEAAMADPAAQPGTPAVSGPQPRLAACYIGFQQNLPNSDIGQTIRLPRGHALKTSPRSRDQAFWRS